MRLVLKEYAAKVLAAFCWMLAAWSPSGSGNRLAFVIAGAAALGWHGEVARRIGAKEADHAR